MLTLGVERNLHRSKEDSTRRQPTSLHGPRHHVARQVARQVASQNTQEQASSTLSVSQRRQQRMQQMQQDQRQQQQQQFSTAPPAVTTSLELPVVDAAFIAAQAQRRVLPK